MRARFLPLLLVPLTGLEAQSAKTTARAPSPSRMPMGGACASISNVPSELVRWPEGMALLRFKKELEGVATVYARDSAMGTQARRMFEVQRGLDSLVQVFVRVRAGDSAQGQTYTFRRGDSAMVVNGKFFEARANAEAIEYAIKAMRPNVEGTVRSVEPRMAAPAPGGMRMVTNASSTGYMGIDVSGAQIRMVTDSGTFTAHCDYPMIEAVDVGSPARQADLRAGDTIVAYNGRDVVAQTINYPQLLVPGRVVRVRVRRDGKPREVPVTVAARPQEVVAEGFRFTPAPGGFLSPVPALSGTSGVFVRSAPGSTPMPARMVAANAAMINVLGAQLYAIDDEFAETVGVEPGIRVMRVHVGSPSADAGLRVGELIQAVNGTPVRELIQVQRAVNASGVRDVKLTVTAKDTPARIVTIRW